MGIEKCVCARRREIRRIADDDAAGKSVRPIGDSAVPTRTPDGESPALPCGAPCARGHVLAFRLAESSRCPCCVRFKDRVILEPPHIRSEVCTSRTAELRIGVCAACRAFEKHAARAAFRAVGYRCRHSQNRALPHDSRAVFRTAVPHFRTCRTASPELVRPCVRLRQSSLKYAQSRADKTGTARASCYRSNQSSPKVCSSLVSSLGG